MLYMPIPKLYTEKCVSEFVKFFEKKKNCNQLTTMTKSKSHIRFYSLIGRSIQLLSVLHCTSFTSMNKCVLFHLFTTLFWWATHKFLFSLSLPSYVCCSVVIVIVVAMFCFVLFWLALTGWFVAESVCLCCEFFCF